LDKKGREVEWGEYGKLTGTAGKEIGVKRDGRRQLVRGLSHRTFKKLTTGKQSQTESFEKKKVTGGGARSTGNAAREQEG